MRRFTSEDTYKGDINNSVTLNYYMYCAGNPLKYSDPSGHMYGLADGVSYGAVYEPTINGKTAISQPDNSYHYENHLANITNNQEKINKELFNNSYTTTNPIKDGLMIGGLFIGVTELNAALTGANVVGVTGSAGVAGSKATEKINIQLFGGKGAQVFQKG